VGIFVFRGGEVVLSFLTPQFFDTLVKLAIVIGLIAAAIRVYGDFRRGPRWPEDRASDQMPEEQADSEVSSTGENKE
jgi:hypothetical protein